MAGKGRHVAGRRQRRRWILFVALGVLLLGLIGGGTAYAAYTYDQRTLHRILPGVRVAGIDLGGMTREEAIERVRAHMNESLQHTFVVEAADERFETTPAELRTRADVEAAVGQAIAVTNGYSWVQRVYMRLSHEPAGQAFEVPVTYDKHTIQQFIAEVGGKVGKAPVSGGMELKGSRLVFVKSRAGRELVAAKSVAELHAALRDGKHRVELPVRRLAPKTTGREQYTIAIRLNQNKLYLYKGKKVQHTYPVATGAPGFPTPEGSFEIVNKRKNPTWVNPDPNGWGASMPAQIPPGPGNPLGTRALDLNAPGIRIHGTYDLASLGTYASHGCIRMSINDVEQLFDIVPVGTPVFIFD